MRPNAVSAEFFCNLKTTRYTRGSNKLIALRKKKLLCYDIFDGLATVKNSKGVFMTLNTLAHTTWDCKYHIVFAPKYRRKAFYGGRRLEIGGILRELCRWKGIGIIEAEVCPDHIHMLLEIPPKYSVSSIMGNLKGKSSLQIYERWEMRSSDIATGSFGVKVIM